MAVISILRGTRRKASYSPHSSLESFGPKFGTQKFGRETLVVGSKLVIGKRAFVTRSTLLFSAAIAHNPQADAANTGNVNNSNVNNSNVNGSSSNANGKSLPTAKANNALHNDAFNIKTSSSVLKSSHPETYITTSPGFVLIGAPGGGKGTISSKFLAHDFGENQFACRPKIVHISVGDLLREETNRGSDLGRKLASYTEKGELAPEELVREVLKKEIVAKSEADGSGGNIEQGSSMTPSANTVSNGGSYGGSASSTSSVPAANSTSVQQPPNTKSVISKPIFMLDGFPRTVEQAQFLDTIMNIKSVIFLDVPDQEVISRVSSRWVHAASGRVYNYLFNPPKVEGVDDITGERLERRADDTPEVVAHRLKVFRENVQPILDYYSNSVNSGSAYASSSLFSSIVASLDSGYKRQGNPSGLEQSPLLEEEERLFSKGGGFGTTTKRLQVFTGESTAATRQLVNENRRSDAIFQEIMDLSGSGSLFCPDVDTMEL